ncbi:hypothetical protein HMI56_004910 [Coelomomyces lativittatus]|nr:hypothetical protein HMI56_004910 [Coelomomyces lativittatus]
MFSLVVLLLLLLSTSISPLVSQNDVTPIGQLGVQTSNPLRFIYANEQFQFGSILIFRQVENPNDLCRGAYAFLGFFASALDTQSASGDFSDDAIVGKLISMIKEVKELFEGKIDNSILFSLLSDIGSLDYKDLLRARISQYLISVKNFLSQIVNTSTCQCTDGTCVFSNPIQNAPVTYTDLYIYQIIRLSGKGPAYWDAKKINDCRQDPKCLVDVVRNSKSSQPTAKPPGGTSPLEIVLDNENIAFGKLSFKFKPELSNNPCKDVYAFFGLFATALDIRTSTGEYLQDDFTRKILSTAKEVKELFRADSKNQFLHSILSFIENISPNDIIKNELLPYFLTIKDQLANIMRTSTCQFTGGKYLFSDTIHNAPETYTDLYIYQIASFINEVPSSWDAKKFNDCGKDANQFSWR